MKRTIALFIFVVVFAGMLAVPGVQAGECTNADLEGPYAGVNNAFYDDLFGHRPFASIGITTFDGNGNLTLVQTVSRNGEIRPPARSSA